MEKGKKLAYIRTAVCFVLFVFWTVMIKLVDVQSIGPEGSEIGFAGINGCVQKVCLFNSFWYHVTQATGLLAIFVMLCFACVGLVQLIKRKSLLKVDYNILALGALYVVVMILYVLFDKIAINYRPIILDEGLEPSYPSTHTFLVLVIMISTCQELGYYIKNSKILLTIRIICILIAVLTVIGRLLCGVHWFTDIIGGILLAEVLVSFPRAKKQEQ